MDPRSHHPQGSSQEVTWAPGRLAARLLSRLLLGARAALTTGLALSGPTLLATLGSQAAVANPKLQTYHIAAGDAAQTLNEFSRQSSLQLLFDYNVVRGRKTRAVSGELPADTALRQMLVDTGLMFDFVNERTLAVTLINHEKAAGAALADAPVPRRRQDRAAQTQSVIREVTGSNELTADAQAPDMEEIRVLGTHVRGEEPAGEHVMHLEREEIAEQPAATVRDLLQSIPQAWGGGPSEDTHFFSAETASNSGLGAGINLRGLGDGATLVLIGGKRMAPSGTEAAFTDIESIPLSAVDRIDILPDGASALYGSDAVGGVVNFVMRDNFTGAETTARRGSGTGDFLDEVRVAQTLGTRWDSGNAMLSLELYKRGDLPASARRYANSDLTSLGGSDFDSNLSNPGNIVVGGQTYAIPRGQNGSQLTAGELTAGTQNLADRYEGADLLPSQKRWSLYTSGRSSLSDSASLFGTALVSRREAQEDNGGVTSQFIVPSSNPFYFNPSGAPGPLLVGYNFLDDIGPQHTDVRVISANVTLGLNIDLGSSWKMTMYGNYSQERQKQLATGLVDPLAVARALADPNPATALNLFGDGSHTNPATLAAIEASSRFDMDSKIRALNVSADGVLAHMPGGDLKLALGIDHRNQTFGSTVSATSLTPAVSIDARRDVTGAYGELRIPFFGRGNSVAGLRKLEASITGRYEDYSDFGGAATPMLGADWSPFESVTLRGTWGHSIRAPDLAFLNTSYNRITSGLYPDKLAASGFSRVLVEQGNSANLSSERAHTWTGGFDVDGSRWAPGLAFGATYFRIAFRDRIQSPPATADLLTDPSFASLVVRNPSASLVQQACSTGGFYNTGQLGVSCAQSAPDAIVDLRNQNLASVTTSGIDLNLQYEHRWPPGLLKFRLDGTYLLDFSQQITPDAPAMQLLNTQNNPIDLKLRALLTWQQLRWGATLGVNFQNHYTDIVSLPNRNIRSLTTFDAQLRYVLPDHGSSLLQNTAIDLNAINLFNVSPPFLNNATAGLGYDQENADPTGRLLGIQVRKSW